MYQTDKIGFASYLIMKSFRLTDVRVKTRNRSVFVFDTTPEQAGEAELEYTRSDFSKFFETFKFLRDRTIRGVKGE